MATHINWQHTDEDAQLRTVLIAAGISLLGCATLITGLCMFLGIIAHGGDRTLSATIMALGLIVGLAGMVVVSAHSPRTR